MWAAMTAIWSRTLRHAPATAPPAMTMERDAKVPMPKGLSALSPWRTEMRSGSMPSSSQATWARVVSRPWPWLWMPVSSTRVPSVMSRAVALSKPGMTWTPRVTHSPQPCAVCSV